MGRGQTLILWVFFLTLLLLCDCFLIVFLPGFRNIFVSIKKQFLLLLLDMFASVNFLKEVRSWQLDAMRLFYFSVTHQSKNDFETNHHQNKWTVECHKSCRKELRGCVDDALEDRCVPLSWSHLILFTSMNSF